MKYGIWKGHNFFYGYYYFFFGFLHRYRFNRPWSSSRIIVVIVLNIISDGNCLTDRDQMKLGKSIGFDVLLGKIGISTSFVFTLDLPHRVRSSGDDYIEKRSRLIFCLLEKKKTQSFVILYYCWRIWRRTVWRDDGTN